MKIDSRDVKIENLLTDKFLIPRFQRPYSWERAEVQDFIEDIFSDDSDEYFIGSMVMYENKDRFALVDGQQRLSTIIIILSVIRDLFQAQGFENLANGIQNYVERPNKENVNEFTLSPETSYPYFQKMMSRGADLNDQPVKDEELRLQKAYKLSYKYFKEKIRSINADPTVRVEDKKKRIETTLSKFRDALLNVRLVTIKLDNEQDAYTVFETLNSRGRDLKVSDLIKNHLLRIIPVKNIDTDFAFDSWKDIVATFDHSSAEINSEDFFMHQWASKYGYTTKRSLFNKFSLEITEKNVDEYMRGTLLDAKIYRLIKEPNFVDTELPIQIQDNSVRRSLLALRLFNVVMPYPALLSILRGFFTGGIRPKHTIDSLSEIEKYHFINSAITSQRSSGSTQRLYSDYAIAVFKSHGDNQATSNVIDKYNKLLKEDLVSYEEFNLHFSKLQYSDEQTKNKRLVQYVLRKIHESFSGGQPVDYSQMTIEHVLPQSNNKGEISDVYGSIGNLIMVNKGLNNRLANADFKEKKKILLESNDPGILNDPIMSFDSWGEEEIKKRTALLADRAYNSIWKM